MIQLKTKIKNGQLSVNLKFVNTESSYNLRAINKINKRKTSLCPTFTYC